MKTKLTITLLLIFIVKFCFAQRNFIKGKLITANKDTLSGYIDYKEWIKSPLEIFFKREMSQPSFVYSSTELSGFIIDFNQETYTSLSFDIEKLSRNGSKIFFPSLGAYFNRTKRLTQKNAFVRVLATGKATLYHFVDKDSEEHFLIKQGNMIEPLVYHIIETGNQTAKIKQYEVQLSEILADACKKLPIQGTAYYTKDMKKLVDNYNDCFKIILRPEIAQNSRGKWEYGVAVGVGYSSIKHIISTSVPPNYVYVQGNGNITPAGGVFLNYVFARGRGKFAIQNEIHTYALKSTATDVENRFRYDIRYLGIQNLFRYTFYIGKPSIYLLGGISNAFIVNDRSVVENIDGGQSELVSAFDRKSEQGLIAGLGVRNKRLMLEGRACFGNGFSADILSVAPTNRYELLAKWNFGQVPQ
ncbi:outer membrane beta-barrel protein [Emticicia sp. C21]|uniref:outer membrane beta-barrel protein n=1 Tax=Emticicia sp. C21 TaxID=2302915 RepID=UPI000E343411|nr:outer membrane beta-barrel protein [Emticicia sp. C21]RFS17636.1 PorT family protein [Emticicia sp. C21]